MSVRRTDRSRDERGQTSVLIIGFAALLLVLVAVVVDASAAFVQRQGLNTIADGAALHGADQGSLGVYADGIPEENLEQTRLAVRQAVADYLRRTGARRRYPGLTGTVRVDTRNDVVTVRLSAPMRLPLSVPGVASTTTVGAEGSAAVRVDR